MNNTNGMGVSHQDWASTQRFDVLGIGPLPPQLNPQPLPAKKLNHSAYRFGRSPQVQVPDSFLMHDVVEG